MTIPEARADRRSRPSHGGQDEAELVRRAQLGSAAAFEQLVFLRGPQLYRYLVVRLRDESDAHDALRSILCIHRERR